MILIKFSLKISLPHLRYSCQLKLKKLSSSVIFTVNLMKSIWRLSVWCLVTNFKNYPITPCGLRPWRQLKDYSIGLCLLGALKSWSFRLLKSAECDVTKIKICEIMGFFKINREIKTKNISLPKINILVQIAGEVLPQLCSNDFIQILLKMAWFLTLGTKPI